MDSIDLIPVVEAAGSAALGLIALAAGAAVRWLIAKWQNAAFERAMQALSQAAHLAVTEVWAGYVKALKAAAADGKLTDQEKRLARQQAIGLLRGFLGRKGLALVVKTLGVEDSCVNAFLGAQVESALAQEKAVARAFGAKAPEKAEPEPASNPTSAASATA